MHHGRLIRLDTPAALKRGLTESCYRITSPDNRKTREILERQPGVLAVQPMGADMHLFVEPGTTTPEKLTAATPFEYHEIEPSLEDVFIALVREQEAPRAA
jgi:hypothetical protein